MNEQELIWSLVAAWASSKGIEIAKASQLFPWLTMTSEAANKWAARVTALLAAMSIHFSFDPQAGVLSITGLTYVGVRNAVGEYVKQYMMQEVAYKKFIRTEQKA